MPEMEIGMHNIYTIAKKYEPAMQVHTAICLAGTRLKKVYMHVYNDKPQFMDPNIPEIHLGAKGFVELFAPKSPEEVYMIMIYLHGHEVQHYLSTASVPYMRAIERGQQEVIRYIASIEDPKRKFRKAKDYDDFIIDLKNDKGIVLNIHGIFEVIRFLANALEDGRIERIRSQKLPGFAVMRTYYRGLFWDKEYEYDEYAELLKNPGKHLNLIMNQILSLATCQLYSKGFVKKYAGTPIIDEIKEYLPSIAGGVMAGQVRAMEPHVVKIARLLAPLIYEAFSAKTSEVEEAIKKMLADMLKAMVDNSPENLNLDERDEETDEGGTGSVFGMSDLEITLPDDVYDKLMEKSKEKGDGEGDGGIRIKREHPKDEDGESEPESEADDTEGSAGNGSAGEDGDAEGEDSKAGKSGKTGSKEKSEEQKSEGTEGSSSGSEDEADEDSEKSSKSGGSKDGDKSDETGKEGSDASGKSGDEGEDSGKGKGQEGDKSSDKGDKSSDDMTGKGTPDSENAKSSGDHGSHGETKNENRAWSSRQGKSSSAGKSSMHGTDLDREKAIEKAMQNISDAEAMAREMAKTEISHINESTARAKVSHDPEVDDTYPTVTDEEVRDILKGTGFSFVETKRNYPVNRPLPPVIAARGKALKRKNEKYFQSLKHPNIRNLDTGSVDSSRVYGLTMGETDIFKRRGKSKVFDGCAYILIDNSGSMWGQKFDEACTAAAVIEEGFKGLFPFKIVSFNDDYSHVTHQVIKGWDERHKENCVWNYHENKGPGGGNADGCSIAIATKELLARREKKKLLVVLSDGAPTEGGSNPVELTKKAVKAARGRGIQVSGIYFEEGDVDPHGDAETFCSIYERDYACVPLSLLDKELVKLFSAFALKR